MQGLKKLGLGRFGNLLTNYYCHIFKQVSTNAQATASAGNQCIPDCIDLRLLEAFAQSVMADGRHLRRFIGHAHGAQIHELPTCVQFVILLNCDVLLVLEVERRVEESDGLVKNCFLNCTIYCKIWQEIRHP